MPRPKRRERVDGCRETIDQLCDDMRGIAQIVHQAYHNYAYDFPQGDRITWRECPKDVCESTRNCIARAGREP